MKRVGSTDLVDAVRRAGEGQSLLDPSLTTRVLERLRTGPDEDQRLASLTPQERRILELITEGYTNRQIADAMILAEKTVKNYISNLLAKLGVERRTQAATFAAQVWTNVQPRQPGLTAPGHDRRSVVLVGRVHLLIGLLYSDYRVSSISRSSSIRRRWGCSKEPGSHSIPAHLASSMRARS